MPELPDVEAYRRRLSAHARGRRIDRTVVTDPGILRNVDATTLDRALRGTRFEEPGRHGKWLIAWTTTGPAVLIHFGMTGDLHPAAGPDGRHRHDRVIFELDRGELRYRNMRKLGGLWLAHDAAEARTLLGTLGPDALGLSRARFVGAIAGRRGRVKAVLMDQAAVSGIGNLLADEALWRARIHPATPVHRLEPADLSRLHRALARVLRTSVERYGNVPAARGWLTAVRGRPGARCPRCREALDRTVVGGRTAYFCPACQAGP